jgi:hypothetical protein
MEASGRAPGPGGVEPPQNLGVLAYSGHREHPDRRIVNTWFTVEVGAKRRALRVSVVGTGFSSLGAFGA